MNHEVTEVPVKPGDVLAEKYQVQRVLGAGAMGVVVAATHLELGNRVALKFMLPQALSGPDAVERFIKEARAASQLSSNHVCRVSDVGRLANGAPYIVMEYLEGKDLHDVLRERGPLPIAVAASYIVQVCDAMSEAHAAGIVHRDLKPQNLFITTKRNGVQVLKVLDFGISKGGIGSASFAQTHTAAIMGSPAYMSPEQLRSSKSVDGRADIWAMGVILYQLTLGRLPFEAEDFLGLAWAATNDPPVAPRAIREAMPADFEAIILRCMEKDREKRYADADELAAALSPFAAQLPRAASEPAGKSKAGASAAAAVPGSLDATMAPPALMGSHPGNETVAPAMQKAQSSGSPATAARPAVQAMSTGPGAPPIDTAGAAPFAGRSTLSGSAGEMAGGTFAPAARSRKWILAGAGGAVVAAVAVVIAISGGKGAGGGTQPASQPGAVPALVDQAPLVAAPVAAPEPTPVAAPPDAGVAVAATPVAPVPTPGKPDRDKDRDRGKGKKPKVEPAKPVPVVKVEPPKDPPKPEPPKVEPKPEPDPPKVEPKVEKPKPKPRDEDEFSR